MTYTILAAALAAALSLQGAPAQAAEGAQTAAPLTADIISEDRAKLIAEQHVPGKAVDVAIEKKRGADRYVVEVRPAGGGAELDVIINMRTGKVLGVEK